MGITGFSIFVYAAGRLYPFKVCQRFDHIPAARIIGAAFADIPAARNYAYISIIISIANIIITAFRANGVRIPIVLHIVEHSVHAAVKGSCTITIRIIA